MAKNRICPSCGSEIKPGSDYCLMCGSRFDETAPRPVREEQPVSSGNLNELRLENYALRLLRQRRFLLVLLALCIILLAVSGIYSLNASKRQAAYNESISAFNNEIQVLALENGRLSDENSTLSSANAELEASLEEHLNGTDGLKRLEILNTVIDFQRMHGNDNTRFADYGADRSLLFMHVGDTAQLRVHFEYTDSLLYWALEKEDIISPEWSTAWVGTTCPLTITALNEGCCEIMFGSDYSEDVFYVLCVVLP